MFPSIYRWVSKAGNLPSVLAKIGAKPAIKWTLRGLNWGTTAWFVYDIFDGDDGANASASNPVQLLPPSVRPLLFADSIPSGVLDAIAFEAMVLGAQSPSTALTLTLLGQYLEQYPHCESRFLGDQELADTVEKATQTLITAKLLEADSSQTPLSKDDVATMEPDARRPLDFIAFVYTKIKEEDI